MACSCEAQVLVLPPHQGQMQVGQPGQMAQTLPTSRFQLVDQRCAGVQVDRQTTVLCHRLKTCTVLDLRIWYRSAPISGITLGSRP
jgi:hypothetical protein